MSFIMELANEFGPVIVVAGFFLAMWAIKLAKKTIKLAITVGLIAVVLIVLGLI